jgi:carboxymethylenebutenolidase
MSDSRSKKFPPSVMSLFDKYVHGLISRREFIDRASGMAVAGLSGAALLDALNPKFAAAQQVAPTDARLRTESVEIPAPGYGKARGYLVQPVKAAGKLPVVLVVHENRGLNPHIEDVARRIALENFVAFAPDALFPLGGYPGDEDKARALFQQLDQAKVREDFLALAKYGMSNFLASHSPEIDAAVPFYGSPPAPADAPSTKAPLLLQFAEQDERINAAWPASEAALKSAGVKYQAYIYPATQHGFNNDTTPRYDKDAAALAWKRTIEFFNQHLRAS